MEVRLVFDEEGRLVEVRFRGAMGRCTQYMEGYAEALRRMGARVEVLGFTPGEEEVGVQVRA